MNSSFNSVEINDFVETYTFTASTDSALPNRCLLPPLPCFPWGYDHHAIFVSWDVAPEAYIIHHPIGRRSNPPGSRICCFFWKQKSCGFGGWGFLGFEFGVVCPSANPQVEREDSARGSGGLDVFQLSVGLWFHTSRVLWKMLRLTLFRDGHHVKSCAPWVMAQGIFQDISIQQQIAGAQHFWVHLSAETQQSGWKPQEWVESWGSVWGWGDHWTLQ